MRAADARAWVADQHARPGSGQAELARRLERLPDSHPASPDYPPPAVAADQRGARDSRAGAADLVRPLTDAEHAEHVAVVKARLLDARASGLATNVLYTDDVRHEVWSHDRRLIHDDLVADIYAAASAVPCDRTAIVTGGLPGSGKTTVLGRYACVDLSQYLMINPDLVKEQMAHRGLAPSVDGLTPMEASDLMHEESSHIAKRLAHRAQADGRNVIWDVTMSKAASVAGRIDALRASEYQRIDGIFVDASLDVSFRRADSRHREGHDQYRAGLGVGGRFTPSEMIYAQRDEAWGSRNRANFERLKDRFDSWSSYDNSADGQIAVLIDSRWPGADYREAGK